MEEGESAGKAKWGRPRLGVALWRPSEGVEADKRGRRRRTATTGRPRVGRPATDETESRDSVVIGRVWTSIFVDVLLAFCSMVLAQICFFG